MAGRRWLVGSAVVVVTALGLSLVVVPTANASGDSARWVDLSVGTGGQRPWFSGNTTPAAARPFGMVQLGPDTTSDVATGRPSSSTSGYSADDTRMRGFSSTHLSGAGCPAFGDVPFLPIVGPLPTDPSAKTVGFQHRDEVTAPGRYDVRLGNGVRVSLAADVRSGLAVMHFPERRRARLLVKASDSLAGTDWARVRFLSARELAVDAVSGGFCGSQGRYEVHVLIRFDRPAVGHGTWGGFPDTASTVAGRGVGGWVAFDTRRAPVVRARVAVSFVDVAGARRNLASAHGGWSLRQHRALARRAWARELARMQTSGGSVSDRRLFTTALYHCLLHPTLVSDVDGRYPGFDGAVHRLPAGRRQYSAVSGWDAYRTQLPLIAWIRPDVASDVVRSLQRAARQGGWLPRWPLVASYTGVMNGDSAAPVIASAYAFGARSFGLGTAVSQLVRNAEVTDAQPGQGWFQPRPGASDYLRLGYVPNTTPERGWLQPHGASTTLEYAVDDFAVSRLAAAAGRAAVASRFRQRSGSWRSLLDDTRDLLLPREPGGAFPGAGYDPAACCDGFQEGNAVQYSWMVPHDMAGLLHRLGARAATIERLAEFHTQLNAGAGRPFAWMGNQPSLATPWAYLWLREPSRTADVVAHVRDQLWTGGSDGIPGNDDLGGLSAWYVWASLGLYPLVPGTAVTAVGPPAFAQVVVRPSQGPLTTLERRGDGAHVRAVRVDGVARSSSWLSLAPARRPDKVIVATTGSRRPAWGTGPNDVPPSFPAR